MKKLINIALLSLLITIVGCGKAESDSDTTIPKKKSCYIIFNINGTEYGKFGKKDGVIFLKDGNETSVQIGSGPEGLHINFNSGDWETKYVQFVMSMKNATVVGHYSFDGLTIGSGGSGTDFSYRAKPGENNYFIYDTDEKLIRTPDNDNGSCIMTHSGIFGTTKVNIIQYTNNNDGHWLLEGNFTARLYGVNVLDNIDNCVSDEEMELSGYFYSEN